MEQKKCKIDGCNQQGTFDKRSNKFYFIKGFCAVHYRKYIKHGDPLFVYIPTRVYVKCKIEGCLSDGQKARNDNVCFVKGYCANHYHKYNSGLDPNQVKHKHGENRAIHPLTRSYYAMKSRCYNKNNKAYKSYGGRGIVVCDRWLGVCGFSNFIKDVGDRPNGMSMDRIDNNGNYEPNNFRWATPHQQCANRRSSNKIVGVYYVKRDNKWAARIEINKKIINIGRFNSFDLAVLARKEYEYKYNIYGA